MLFGLSKFRLPQTHVLRGNNHLLMIWLVNFSHRIAAVLPLSALFDLKSFRVWALFVLFTDPHESNGVER